MRIVPTIRRATLTDADAVAQLLTQLGHSTTPDQLHARWPAFTAAGNIALVAANDACLLGLATLHVMHVLHRPAPVGRITALVVDERARGTGLGRALVAAAEDELRRHGCGLVEVTSNDRLTDAHAFYGHLGYARTSVRFVRAL